MEGPDADLAHFGVKGMKWGVRKDRKSSSSGPTDVVVKTKAGQRIQTSGGKGLPASEDAKRVSVYKQKASSSTTDSLSTKELQELVTRMNLEQQYSKLTAGQNKTTAAKGMEFVKTGLKVGKTVNEVVSFVNSPVGKMLRQRLAG